MDTVNQFGSLQSALQQTCSLLHSFTLRGMGGYPVIPTSRPFMFSVTRNISNRCCSVKQCTSLVSGS